MLIIKFFKSDEGTPIEPYNLIKKLNPSIEGQRNTMSKYIGLLHLFSNHLHILNAVKNINCNPFSLRLMAKQE